MTVFVDHFSNLSYVHAQKTTSAQETIESKHAFECFARSHGIQVKHYHADNGRFAEQKFTNDVAEKGQTISYCGVNAHFQMVWQRNGSMISLTAPARYSYMPTNTGPRQFQHTDGDTQEGWQMMFAMPLPTQRPILRHWRNFQVPH